MFHGITFDVKYTSLNHSELKIQTYIIHKSLGISFAQYNMYKNIYNTIQ